MEVVRLNAFFYSFNLPLETVQKYNLMADHVVWYKGTHTWYVAEKSNPACYHWFPPHKPTEKPSKWDRSCLLCFDGM